LKWIFQTGPGKSIMDKAPMPATRRHCLVEACRLFMGAEFAAPRRRHSSEFKALTLRMDIFSAAVPLHNIWFKGEL
jgi:hypothetical protein